MAPADQSKRAQGKGFVAEEVRPGRRETSLKDMDAVVSIIFVREVLT